MFTNWLGATKISRMPTKYIRVPTQEASAKNAPANSAMTGSFAPQGMNGASIAVARHDLRAGEAKLAQVQDEYAALHSELFGYDDSAYTVPTGCHVQNECYIDNQYAVVEIYAKRLAADMLSELCGYDGQRTFNMFQYKDVEVSLTPIAEADASRNVTAEERALGEAWIADISALVRYTGMMGDTGGFGWTDISAYNGLGWLIWKESDTYCIRSRYLS